MVLAIIARHNKWLKQNGHHMKWMMLIEINDTNIYIERLDKKQINKTNITMVKKPSAWTNEDGEHRNYTN